MSKFVLAAVAAASMLAAVAPAKAQWYGDRWDRYDRYRGDRVIVQEQPGIKNSTLITLFALQALQAAQQPKQETFADPAPAPRKYVPLK